MPGGRPTKYKKKYCDELIKHMSKGLSFETFAPANNLGVTTVQEWVDVHPEFAAAKRAGNEYCRLFWEKLGIGLAAGKVKNGSTGVWVYNMKCRFRKEWTERLPDENPEAKINVNIKYDPNK